MGSHRRSTRADAGTGGAGEVPGGRRRGRARGGPATGSGDAVRITSAAASLSEDVAARSRRYLVQMSIRVVCFLGAVLVDHWSRWLLLGGAVVLPYVAVVLANAGRERRTQPETYLSLPPRRALPGAEDPRRGPGAAD